MSGGPIEAGGCAPPVEASTGPAHALRLLVAVARAAHTAMDDGEETRDFGTHIDSQNTARLTEALDALDELPDVPGDVVMDGWARAAHYAALAASQEAPRAVSDEARAVEFGGYLATAADRALEALNAYHVACGKDGQAHGPDEVCDAEESLSDACTALRSAIYEFRKRRDRALAASTPPASQGDAAPAGDAVRELIEAGRAIQQEIEEWRHCTGFDDEVVARHAAALAAAPAPAAPAGDADRLVTSITLPQAQALVAYFGGDNTEVLIYDLPEGRITDDDGKPSPAGLYAVCAECPEEGATYLGDHDPDAPTHPREVVTEAMVADVLDCQPLTAENRGSRFYQLLTVPHDQAPAVMRFVLEVALAARSGARKASQ